MPILKLFLLGAPRLEHDGETVRLPRQKSLALLAYLAVTAREHARQKLMVLLWPEFSEAQARQALRTALADIRRAVGEDHLLASAETVALDPTAGLWLDTQQIDTGAFPAQPTPFLEGFNLRDAPDFDDWAAFERDRWQQAAVKKLRVRAEAEEAQGQLARALETTGQLLALDPLQEAAHRQRMRLHFALGDRSAALQHYETVRALLARELGVEPMAETRALHRQILADEVPAVATAAGPPALRPAARPEPSARGLPFTGRAAERAQLGRCWETAGTGRAQFVFVEGEAGVGKTRLVQEAAIAWAGACILRGTSHPLDTNEPYHPLIDLLRDYARDLAELPNLPGFSDDWLGELTRLVPEWRDRRPAVPSALRVQTVQERSGLIDAEQERNRLFEAVSRFLHSLTQQQPVAVIFDDVHWADPSTLALLAYLSHSLAGARLLVVCTYRGAEMPAPLESLLQALSRQGQLTRLALHRLEPGEVASLAQAVTCQTSLPFAAWLYHESEGNPFFIRELIAYLLEAGLVQQGAEGWQTDLQRWTAALPAALPAGIHDLIRARLQHASEQARQLLDAAAIAGLDFDFATLERASGKDADLLLDALDELLRVQLVRQTVQAAAPYEFTHTKIREVILNEMSLARQQILHRRIGEALEVTQREHLSELAGVLAEHFRAAGDWAKAARYARAAGDHARQVLALTEAAGFYTAALEALSHLDEPDITARVYAALGEVYRALGRLALSIASLAQALSLWQKAGDQAHVAAMRFEMGTAHMFLSEYRQAHELARAGLRDLETLAHPDDRLVAQGHVLWGNALSMESQALPEAKAHLQLGVEGFTRAGDLAGRVLAYFTLGNVAAQEGELDQAVGYFLQTLDEAVKANDLVMEALACNNAAHHCRLLGRRAEAWALAQHGLALAEAHTIFSVLAFLYGTLSDLSAEAGRWDEAEAWLQKGMALAEQLNSAERRADYLAKLAEVAVSRQQYSLALERLQAAARLADEIDAHYAAAQYHLRLAALLTQQGAAADAARHWQRGWQIAQEGHYGRLLAQAEASRPPGAGNA